MSAMKPRASCNHGPKGMRRKGPILCVEFALFKFPSWHTKSQQRPIFCPPFFLAAQPLSPPPQCPCRRCRSHHFGGTNGFGTTRLLGSAETTHKKTQNWAPKREEHWSKRQIIYMQNGKWNSGQLHTLRIICQQDMVYLQSQLLTSGTKFSTTGSVAVVPKVPWACETSVRMGIIMIQSMIHLVIC